MTASGDGNTMVCPLSHSCRQVHTQILAASSSSTDNGRSISCLNTQRLLLIATNCDAPPKKRTLGEVAASALVAGAVAPGSDELALQHQETACARKALAGAAGCSELDAAWGVCQQVALDLPGSKRARMQDLGAVHPLASCTPKHDVLKPDGMACIRAADPSDPSDLHGPEVMPQQQRHQSMAPCEDVDMVPATPSPSAAKQALSAGDERQTPSGDNLGRRFDDDVMPCKALPPSLAVCPDSQAQLEQAHQKISGHALLC